MFNVQRRWDVSLSKISVLRLAPSSHRRTRRRTSVAGLIYLFVTGFSCSAVTCELL